MKKLNSLLNWIRELLSDNGDPSSTRVLMFIFSFFTMHLIWRCFYHIYQLTDLAIIGIWLANMPLLITSCMGLISLPYALSKGTSAITGIANSMANVKTSNTQTTSLNLTKTTETGKE